MSNGWSDGRGDCSWPEAGGADLGKELRFYSRTDGKSCCCYGCGRYCVDEQDDLEALAALPGLGVGRKWVTEVFSALSHLIFWSLGHFPRAFSNTGLEMSDLQGPQPTNRGEAEAQTRGRGPLYPMVSNGVCFIH